MKKEQLLTQLHELHDELRNIEDVDPNVLSALGQIASDIQDLVEQHDPSTKFAETEGYSFLKNQIEEFETKHPTVTRFLSQLADFMAAVGI